MPGADDTPRRGRPRSFDADEALDRAVELFWKSGHGACSLDELVEETGVPRQSLYRVFGNKDELYRKSLERYGARLVEHLRTLLLDSGSAREGLLALVDLWERDANDAEPKGCLTMNTLAELAREGDSPLTETARRNFKAAEGVVRKAIERAQADGELPGDLSSRATARQFMATGHAAFHFGRSGLGRGAVRDVLAGVRAVLGSGTDA